MSFENLNRTVTLLCPDCGSNQFAFDGDDTSDASTVKCSGCGRESTKADLIAANRDRIDAEVKKIGEEATEEVARQLKKSLQDAFRGSTTIKVK